MTKKPDKEKTKITLKEAFEEYAKKEMEFYQTAEKGKLYSRVLPNLKEKDKGSIDFFYNGVIIGGYIHKQDIVLNKLKVTKFGVEEDVPKALDAIKAALKESDMVLDIQLK